MAEGKRRSRKGWSHVLHLQDGQACKRSKEAEEEAEEDEDKEEEEEDQKKNRKKKWGQGMTWALTRAGATYCTSRTVRLGSCLLMRLKTW